MKSDPSKIYGRGYQLGSIGPRCMIAYHLIAGVVCRIIQPQTAIDLGSGAGPFVKGLRSHGVFAFGIEGDRNAVDLGRENEIDIRYHDLRSYSIGWAERADLVTSFDVAEHIAQQYDDGIVNAAVLSAKANGTILFGAAPPGQDGVDHINLQPPDYWTAKFEKLGWKFDPELTELIKTSIVNEPAVRHEPMDGFDEACHNVVWWVEKNLRAYKKA